MEGIDEVRRPNGVRNRVAPYLVHRIWYTATLGQRGLQLHVVWREGHEGGSNSGEDSHRSSCKRAVQVDTRDIRYYNANAGRFYTPDPAGMKAVDPKNPTMWNMYAYASGDPVNRIDPRGLEGTAVRMSQTVEIPVTDPWLPYDPCALGGDSFGPNTDCYSAAAAAAASQAAAQPQTQPLE